MGILSLSNKHTSCNEIFEQNKKSDASMIYSDASKVEEFSIELSVGDQWAEDISKEKAIMYAIENEEISIKPQTSIVLEIKEDLHVPFNMYGLVLQTGSVFLEQGILIGSGKIEPSFNGKLRLLIFNTSKTKRVLKKGQKIASAIFMRTDKTIKAPIYNHSRDSVQKNRGIIARLHTSFLSDKKFVITIVVNIITSSLAVALITGILPVNNKTTASLNQISIKTEPKTTKTD